MKDVLSFMTLRGQIGEIRTGFYGFMAFFTLGCVVALRVFVIQPLGKNTLFV